MNVAIIGGGAAGFFAAIAVKENHPTAKVVIIEKTQKILSKVKISGGGRCNLTNGCNSIAELCKAYPRGEKSLKKIFHVFNNKNTIEWFESRGIKLVIQDDNCVFPESQDSQTIIDRFLAETRRLGIQIERGKAVANIKPVDSQLEIQFIDQHIEPERFDKIIVAIGGQPQRSSLLWLEQLKHQIEQPVPSLFTFNLPTDPIKLLMGLVVENALVGIQGTKLKADGPLLITHWGMSGPAILKLSAYGARHISEANYDFKIQVNWVHQTNCEIVYEELEQLSRDHLNKLLANKTPYSLPSRLWLHLLEKAELSPSKKWGDLGKKSINKLVNLFTNDVYEVKGKTHFRDEFVTCGGVSLESIDLTSMQSRVCKNLYFAGEVLDIDAITGGFNFQAAWSTAFVAAKLSD